jgi:hypothetical protein
MTTNHRNPNSARFIVSSLFGEGSQPGRTRVAVAATISVAEVEPRVPVFEKLAYFWRTIFEVHTEAKISESLDRKCHHEKLLQLTSQQATSARNRRGDGRVLFPKAAWSLRQGTGIIDD